MDPAAAKYLQEQLTAIGIQIKQNSDALEQFNEQVAAGAQSAKTALENKIQENKLELELIELKRRQIELQVAIGKTSKENADIALKMLATDKERLVAANKLEETQVAFGKAAANSLSSMTGIGQQSKTMVGQLIQAKAQGVGFSASIGQAAEQFGKSITAANLVALAVDKIIAATLELAKQQDKAYVKFEKEVGNVKNYKDQIMDLRNANGMYGVSVQNAAESFSTLKKEFAGFESMSKTQQSTLATTSAQLGKLGIAEADVAKTQETLVKGMGITVVESTNLQKSLYATANAMGLPPQRVASEFAKAAPALSAHGKNMTKVFLDLQNNAKNTGIEFNRLLAITGKFDTFEGAADAAGQLNAILGGDYLNSIELLNATEGERVRILQDSLKASGKSIDTMSKQEQMAAAQAIGLSDVGELQKLMNNETANGTVKQIEAEKAQKQMNEAIKDATELGEVFKNLMAKLAIEMRPVIEAIKSVVMGITDFIDKNPLAAKGIMFVVAGFAALVAIGGVLFLVINSVLSAMASLATISGVAGPAVAASSQGMAAGIRTVGTAATQGALGLLALGATALMIGAGIGLAALGLAQLVKSFSGLGEAAWPAAAAVTAISFAFVGLTMALVPLIPLLLLGAPGLLAFGAAMLLVGAGVAIAATGVGYMTKGIGEMFDTLSKANSKNITAVFDALFDAMSLTGIGKVAAFAAAISGLADDMAELNKNTVAVVGNLNKMGGTANVSVNTSQATTTPRVSTATAAAMNTNTGGGGTTGATTGGSNITPVAIYIDSKKIGEILDPRYKQMIQDSLRNIGGKAVPI
jgi:hypothetical protein